MNRGRQEGLYAAELGVDALNRQLCEAKRRCRRCGGYAGQHGDLCPYGPEPDKPVYMIDWRRRHGARVPVGRSRR